MLYNSVQGEDMIQKKIPIGDAYYAREDGEIVSMKYGKEKILKKTLNKQNGYYSVSIGYEINKYKTYNVHYLICLAFHGEKPDDMEVMHFDGDRLNNCPSNLSYGTRLENHADKIRHGTSGKGELNSNAKLTEEDVINIRKKYKKGVYGYIRLGKEFNVLSGTIQKIINREIWKHI